MKRRVVEWLFFIICCNIVLLHHSLCETEAAFIASEAHQGHHLPLMKQRQLKNAYKSERTLKGLHEALQLRARVDVDVEEEKKAIIDHNRKGKGSYGGGDLLRPRGKRNEAKSLLLKSPSLLSLVLRYAVLAFLPSIFFF